MAPEAASASLFWPHIPAPLLESRLCDVHAARIPYELFEPPHWQAFLAALARAPERAAHARAFECAPESVLEAALALGIASQALFAALFQRAPERAERELEQALDAPDERETRRLAALLAAAPDAELPSVFALVSRPNVQNLGGEKLRVVRRFLHGCVRTRRPGYREAYACLSVLEQRLAPALERA